MFKKTLLNIFLSFSLNVLASTKTEIASEIVFHNKLTVPNYCENGTKIGKHRFNCIQWIKLNSETKRALIMLTDVPLVGKYSVTFTHVIVDFNNEGYQDQMIFMVDANNNLVRDDGTIWYLQ